MENYEEKYRQALETGARLRKELLKNDAPATVSIIERIFPELAESEDEKIRQLLIRFVKYDMPNNYSDDFSKEDCLAWLEKQGEQKTVGWSKSDEFHYDKLKCFLEVKEYQAESSQYQREVHETLDWLKSLKDRVQPQPKQELSEWDKSLIECLIKHLESELESSTYTKEGKEFFSKSIFLLKSLKERCCPQNGDYHEGFKKGFAKARVMNCHWKPSEEQLKCLDKASGLFSDTEVGNYRRIVLEELLEQLKALV